MEESLWQGCDKLRGSVESSEYKHIVLGLIFLKFASDKFETRREELIANGMEKYIEMKDFYTMENVFFLKETSRWSYIQNNAKQNDQALIIDTALHAIEKVTDTYHQWQAGEIDNVPEFCYSADLDEISKKYFLLVPSKYIEFVNRDEFLDYEDQMEKLQEELRDLFAEEEQLKEDVKEVFKSLGYDLQSIRYNVQRLVMNEKNNSLR